ncbi:MAG: malto-oligosyltrehalose synthase [Ignavibacteriaceae bacterium]
MIHIPCSTYRIQFTSQFTFADAEKIISYLANLGITDIYASPIFKARKGSTHGYDIVDPNQLNPELGGEEDFEKLRKVCNDNNIKWLQDIVPNHMAYNYENQMLVDVLENGHNSRYFNFFDIEWNHPHASSYQRVLAPFLGKFYQEALEAGEIKLKYDENGFSINYYENHLPLKMESYADVLSYRLDKLRNKLGMNNPDFIKYQGIIHVLKFLSTAPEIDERYYQIKFAKGIIWELYNSNYDIKDFLDEAIKIFNSEREFTGNFDLLDKLLGQQYFRLCYWKVATEEINYRRFFNINELISLRMENEDTFNRTHSLILRSVKDGKFNGLRIDHVDGLYDPQGYLERLRERAKDAYIVVEKILELEEEFPEGWPVQGTTGYEFMNYLNGLFCYTQNAKKFTGIYSKFTGFDIPFDQLFHEKKRLIIEARMAGEVERLAFLIESVSSKDRYGVDITMYGIKRALVEVLTYFPIYRTYVREGGFSERDKKYISGVIKTAIDHHPRLINEFNYIGKLLLQEFGNRFSDKQKKQLLDFIMKFQQLTGPLMAKGFEDTTLYIYNRFLSLNEVGGKPVKFGIKKEEFFEFVKKRLPELAHSLNSTSTHDTKRGEDVRARLNVISEIPDEWELKIKHWNKINRRFKTSINGKNFPDKNDEYFLYQTMAGSYPAYPEEHDTFLTRLKEYVIKAVREAKVYTAWLKPDMDYENAFTSFVDRIMNREESKEFLDDFFEFQQKTAYYGVFNSLSQTLIKLTAPGVPDLYQGTEMWDFSMVDPDNRRPVDYYLREKILKEIDDHQNNLPGYLDEIINSYHDARIKVFLVQKTLHFRKNKIEIFNDGDFIPLTVSGLHQHNIIAFARKINGNVTVTVVPRFLTELIKKDEKPFGNEVWKDTSVEFPFDVKIWQNVLTGEKIEGGNKIKAGNVLKLFPVALLRGIID